MTADDERDFEHQELEPGELEPGDWSLSGHRIAFLGKLGGFTRRELPVWVREQGAILVEPSDPSTDLVVIGADELPLGDGELLKHDLEVRAASGNLEIISETELWQRLGQVESDLEIRRLYTPAMVAQLLHLPVQTIRRWHRRGLIQPVREVLRLPYFDFTEVATARRLAELVAGGMSAAAIERKLNDLARLVPGVQRPLAQLSVIVQGGELLLRQADGLMETGGQRRIDFEALEQGAPASAQSNLSIDGVENHVLEPITGHELIAEAQQLEDSGRLEDAAELYRAAMAADGPRAEWCFQLAELLYRLGDLTAARERYYMAIELDEDYLEARANLGCVLAECGQPDLAIAALEGTLSFHRQYPDVHYHLAKLFDEHGGAEQARHHWREFVELAPDSPWADEARARLDELQ